MTYFETGMTVESTDDRDVRGEIIGFTDAYHRVAYVVSPDMGWYEICVDALAPVRRDA